MGMAAYALEENGEYRNAMEKSDLALQINIKDIWASHAKAHVFEMQFQPEEGIRHLETSVEHWTGDGMKLQCHMFWHWALYNLQKGDNETALTIWDEMIKRAKATNFGNIADITSLLYRMELRGFLKIKVLETDGVKP